MKFDGFVKSPSAVIAPCRLFGKLVMKPTLQSCFFQVLTVRWIACVLPSAMIFAAKSGFKKAVFYGIIVKYGGFEINDFFVKLMSNENPD